MHQVFRTEDQKDQCPYCHSNLKDAEWDTHFESTRLYKSVTCNCGRFISIPMCFLGSGHDTWDPKEGWRRQPNIKIPKTKQKIKTLESKIKVIKEYSHHP